MILNAFKGPVTSNVFKVILPEHIENTVDIIESGMVRWAKTVTCSD